MTSRRNDVTKRAKLPGPKGVAVIQAVNQRGQLTRAQIQRLLFRKGDGTLSSFQTVCRLLKDLTERGYLSRVRLPVERGSGPYVYTIGDQAKIVLHADEMAQVRPPRSRSRPRTKAGLLHGLEITDFYLALKEGLERQGGALVAWLSENQARCPFQWQGKKLLLTPDGYAVWALDGEEGSFLLEWDRGTEAMNRIAEKLTRYMAYYGQGIYRDHLGETGLRPRLLIVVPHARRERQVAGWLGRKLAKGELEVLPTVLVVRWDMAQKDVLGPVWVKAGQSGRMRLVD